MELVWQERSLAGRILSLTHGQAPAPPPEPAATAPERVHPKLHIYIQTMERKSLINH